MDMRPILFVIGILLCTLAASMILPIMADAAVGNDDWRVFLLCMTFTAFFGGALILTNQNKGFSMTIRQTFLLTTLSWVVLSVAAASPFALSGLQMSWTNALFEAVSGITTTGSTVITGLDNAPPGILLWRSILQWLGGIGIIIMALSVLPFLKVGGMQLFQIELSENEKALPRLTSMASTIGIIYIGLTLAGMVMFNMAGMTKFEALVHSMSTISTGGFSTSDSSIGHFDSAWVEMCCILFMILGCLPFVLYVKAVRGNVMPLFKDTQVRWFLSILGISIVLLTIYLIMEEHFSFESSIRKAAFNVTSLMTGTGFSNHDYDAWGGFPVALLFFLMVVGGCAGSTTCGIKVFRFQVLYAVTMTQIKQLIHPHGVFTPHYNNHPLPPGIAPAVMSFFFVYALCFSLLAIGLSFVGLDFMSAMSGAVTTISNVGPGMGDIIGPTGTFQPLPDAAKWLMCVGMILGRLELFTVLVLFMPAFWRK